MSAVPGVIVALDGLDPRAAKKLAFSLMPERCRLKVGSELFLHAGPDIIRELRRIGYDVFLDLKFHDIPNTVAAAVRAACALDVQMCTVHAAGGAAMLEAARDAAAGRLAVLAVTVLTSLDDADLMALGQPSARTQVEVLANLAAQCGLCGVVCSPREAEVVRARQGAGLQIVTPGIRRDAARGDQKRTATPHEAARAGADWLVVGRPVTEAAHPPRALEELCDELAQLA